MAVVVQVDQQNVYVFVTWFLSKVIYMDKERQSTCLRQPNCTYQYTFPRAYRWLCKFVIVYKPTMTSQRERGHYHKQTTSYSSNIKTLKKNVTQKLF